MVQQPRGANTGEQDKCVAFLKSWHVVTLRYNNDMHQAAATCGLITGNKWWRWGDFSSVCLSCYSGVSFLFRCCGVSLTLTTEPQKSFPLSIHADKRTNKRKEIKLSVNILLIRSVLTFYNLVNQIAIWVQLHVGGLAAIRRCHVTTKTTSKPKTFAFS